VKRQTIVLAEHAAGFEHRTHGLTSPPRPYNRTVLAKTKNADQGQCHSQIKLKLARCLFIA
jgi:hypothetical protein